MQAHRKKIIIPLVVDQSYKALTLGKQLAVALLSVELERGERFVSSKLIGWPLLIKRIGEKKYIIFDKTELLFSKFSKKVYPDFTLLSEEFRNINSPEDFIQRLEQLRIDEIKSNIEINIPSLINIDLNFIDKLNSNPNSLELNEILPEKLINSDVQTYLNIFSGLCNEVNSVRSAILSFISVVDSVYYKFEEFLNEEIEGIKKKYSGILESKKSEIKGKIEEIKPKIENELRVKYEEVLKDFINTEVELSKAELEFEAGLINENDLDSKKRKANEIYSQLLSVRTTIEDPYIRVLRNEREFMKSQELEMNNTISLINSKIKALRDSLKLFKERVDKALQELDATEKYLNSFYNKLETFTDDEFNIIIPFIVIKTNKDKIIVVKPAIYKGKSQGMLSRIFKRTDLVIEYQTNFSPFINYLRTLQQINDNILNYSQEINEGLKEVEKDGWKSKDSVNEFYS